MLAAPKPEKQHWAGTRLDPQNGAPFSVSLARDARNDVWLGTEDKGVWRFDSQTKEWKQFTTKDGLGDNDAYALCVDRLNRVWVGHLKSGVSVWNGQSWKNYGVLEGPLGERIFALACNPTNGDVWMATNAGLSRYNQKNAQWTHFTQASGLPTNKISCLSFDSLGNIYVGTQCDGLVVGRSESNYSIWTQTKGPDEFPDRPRGKGLPSNFINDVFVADDDRIYVATTCGLAVSNDFGASFEFWRGRDYRAKLGGLYAPRKATDIGNMGGELLREDYVSNIAEDERGLLWIGYRLAGFEVRRPLSHQTHFASQKEDGWAFSYVSTLLPLGDGTALIASYSDGLSLSAPIPDFVPNAAEKEAIRLRRGWKVLPDVQTLRAVSHPKASEIPDKIQIEALLAEAKAANEKAAASDAPFVASLPDDWTTQGDWRGRYGRHTAILCAMLSPRDYVWGAGSEKIRYHLCMDPREKGNSLRYWVHWLQSDYRRVLEMPAIYAQSRHKLGLAKPHETRRQSEVDDNGEEYPLTKEGPDVYANLQIPSGTWVVSFYNHNKDGHSGFNRARDYAISLRTKPRGVALEDVRGFDGWPEAARHRQRDFWGGVYQKYLVRGPQTLCVKYAKNNSFNTILAGVFLDKVDERSGGEEPEPYFSQAPRAFADVEPNRPEAATVSELWNELERARTQNPQWWASESRRFYVPLAKWHEAARLHTPFAGSDRLHTVLLRLQRFLEMGRDAKEATPDNGARNRGGTALRRGGHRA